MEFMDNAENDSNTWWPNPSLGRNVAQIAVGVPAWEDEV